jgi:hypothetical protein
LEEEVLGGGSAKKPFIAERSHIISGRVIQGFRAISLNYDISSTQDPAEHGWHECPETKKTNSP